MNCMSTQNKCLREWEVDGVCGGSSYEKTITLGKGADGVFKV